MNWHGKPKTWKCVETYETENANVQTFLTGENVLVAIYREKVKQ